MKIGILDYGAGNIQSVVNMFLYLGEEIKIISSKEELLKIEKLILPGVGNFDHLINELKKRDFLKKMKWSEETLNNYLARPEKPHNDYSSEAFLYNMLKNIYLFFMRLMKK